MSFLYCKFCIVFRGVSLYNILYDIRCKIFDYLSSQDKKFLCSINRTWRSHLTPNLRKVTLPYYVSCEFLKPLLNIEEIKIFGPGRQLAKFDCIEKICSLIKSGSFEMLSSLVITGIIQILTLIDAVKLYVQFRYWCCSWAKFCTNDFTVMYQSCTKLKYLSFYQQCKNENRNSILIGWVDLLDNYYGYVCFGHNVLDRIPKKMQTYDRNAYSMPCRICLNAKTTQK
jgi:hypothetical protein